jgi:hypothetical protein
MFSISLISYGQKNNYNDWFDFNLKAGPRSVKEITLLNLTTFFEPDFTAYLNSSLKLNAIVDEYYFDTLGLVSKEYHKNILDTLGRWIDYSKMDLFQFRDSIIIVSYYSDGDEEWREKRFLDHNGYICSKIIESFCPDTIVFKRDSHNRIIEKYRNWYCIDYGKKENTVYELNDNGDIITERRKEIIADSQEANEKSIIRYEYIYDANLNWVIKVTHYDNEILSITQRKLEY